MHDAADTRGVIRCVGLELSCAQSLLERALLVHHLVNRIGLVAVRDNRLIAENTYRRINDQARVGKLRRIKCLRADSVSVLYKNTVAAVYAPSHNKISSNRIFAVCGSAQYNPSSGIRVALKFLTQGHCLHV